MADESSTAIFLHLLKAAGTTLHRIIERQYAPEDIFTTERPGGDTFEAIAEFQALPRSERRNIRMLKGHMGFGLHEYLPQPAVYFTFLREPRSRILSHMNFIAESHEHPANAALVSGELTYTDLLREPHEPLLDNCMVRLVSGVWNDVPYGEIGEEEFRTADRNLREHFAVVGLTERFDASLLPLRRRFGWDNVFYTRHNVARRRLRWEELDEEARALARRNNKWDRQLYATAVELFEKQVAAQGPAFRASVTAFKLRQRWMKHYRALYWRVRRVSVRQMIRERLKQQ